MRIVLASTNSGKLAEIRRRLSTLGDEAPILSGEDPFAGNPPPEDAPTFVENALIKARAACANTGLPAIADDSGIAVDALGGRPGIRSARYAGEHASDRENIAHLLDELRGVALPERTATFICVIVFMLDENDPCPLICEGRWAGRILEAPEGRSGFGYDPIFFDDAIGMSAAELSPERKNAVSHRGQALDRLIRHLEAIRGSSAS
ncbi:RdgB/HAM1 family non-canonical purine NTP pyrophosphatase [Thioalkalivibrio sp. HK1]|uniref:RdgB/HAM1 family non-canonical purine NTP pyrophosphatase n=1 Tax=Thioalkalivibrio sp. HK1 TaxID=1469245 RepID=UPI000570EAD4|nr:RdgB/HAM1 family non-canonical purine NTP pyrophosphatase [Thioalkalivibrio sp. HK1]